MQEIVLLEEALEELTEARVNFRAIGRNIEKYLVDLEAILIKNKNLANIYAMFEKGARSKAISKAVGLSADVVSQILLLIKLIKQLRAAVASVKSSGVIDVTPVMQEAVEELAGLLSESSVNGMTSPEVKARIDELVGLMKKSGELLPPDLKKDLVDELAVLVKYSRALPKQPQSAPPEPSLMQKVAKTINNISKLLDVFTGFATSTTKLANAVVDTKQALRV